MKQQSYDPRSGIEEKYSAKHTLLSSVFSSFFFYMQIPYLSDVTFYIETTLTYGYIASKVIRAKLRYIRY